jgi:two-component system phosphate regulon sensor histidine kinase PhoR
VKLRISFKTWIFISTMLVVLGTLAFVAVFLQRSFQERMLTQVRDSLLVDTALLREIALDRWSGSDSMAETDALADLLGNRLNLRVTLITPDGKVTGDSSVDLADLPALENHADRPEIRTAMEKGWGWSRRYSSTLEYDLIYVARLLGQPDRPLLVLRLAMPLADMASDLDKIRRLILWASLLGGILSLGVAFLVAHQIFRPVNDLTKTALSISSGDLNRRLRRYPDHEIGDLGRAFDRMADHLQEEIEAVTRARDRLEAILRGMVEGVLVTDADGRVTQANLALREMLAPNVNPLGRKPSEIFRNADLIEAFQVVSSGSHHANLEFRTLGKNPKTLEVELAALPGEGSRSGVVAVFHDITERKHVEEMRRDFVANVSHELRTPLAAIRGAVETLLDGALDDKKFNRKFTEVIERHVRRLEDQVMDLLELARLESGEVPPQFEKISAKSLAESALAAVRELASSREVELSGEIPDPAPALKGDRRQLEQAIINLLDNAVKYTEPGGKVVLSVESEGPEVRLSVADNGIGIPTEHQNRIFERFYRVDKDRSREMGGTGLGLAIVKHVVQSHGGRVELESFPGRGTTFRLILPA